MHSSAANHPHTRSGHARPPLAREDYARQLRVLLPPQVFAPRPAALWRAAAHLGVMALGFAALAEGGPWWRGLLLSILIGHSQACVAFICHDLSHGAVVRHKLLLPLLEKVLWGAVLVPATFWRRVHMQGHHQHPSLAGDPDRKFKAGETTRWGNALAAMSIPSSHSRRWLPTILAHFPIYVARYTLLAFLPGRAASQFTTVVPPYRHGDQARLLGEFLIIGALQWCVFHAVGQQWDAYVWAVPVASLWGSSVVMAYACTHHHLNAPSAARDPLAVSTSVSVPRLLNRLHSNASFHTEHHVFPSMHPDFHPLVCALLQQHHPERYHRVEMGEAWRQLWETSPFLLDEPVYFPARDRAR